MRRTICGKEWTESQPVDPDLLHKFYQSIKKERHLEPLHDSDAPEEFQRTLRELGFSPTFSRQVGGDTLKTIMESWFIDRCTSVSFSVKYVGEMAKYMGEAQTITPEPMITTMFDDGTTIFHGPAYPDDLRKEGNDYVEIGTSDLAAAVSDHLARVERRLELGSRALELSKIEQELAVCEWEDLHTASLATIKDTAKISAMDKIIKFIMPE